MRSMLSSVGGVMRGSTRCGPGWRVIALVLTIVTASAGVGVSAASAQNGSSVIDETQHVDFDRPEAWAMKFFGSVAAFTPLGEPVVREPGSIDVSLEVTQ